MATMYIERSGTCRRRASSGDVIEPWFLMSRSAYQRILDVALADMTSAEVQRASRGSELLRLLSAGDDVTTQMSRQPSDGDACDKSRVDALSKTSARDVSVKSSADVPASSPEIKSVDTLPSKSLPLSLVSNQISGAADFRRRLDKDHSRRCEPETDVRNHVATTSSTPTALCLRVPSYVRSHHAAVTVSQSQPGGKKLRPIAETLVDITPPTDNTISDQNCNVVDATTHWRSLAPARTHINDESRSVDDDVRPPLRSQQHSVEKLETDENRCRKNDLRSSKDLTRKRKSVRQPETEIIRMNTCKGDGWAPIDKDILVGIVERLSVSCLQPQLPSSSSSSSSVGTDVVAAVSTSSQSEFRQPMTLTTPRRCDSGRTAAVDVTKRAALSIQPLVMLSTSPSTQAPPYKTQRLATSSWSPWLTSRNSGRRKSTFQRRVQVRDTWSVPSAYKPLQSRSESDITASEPRHVWAPLEKSVVLNVIDHILVDSDADDKCSEAKKRCEQASPSSSRRRYLQPPSLRAITTSVSSPTLTAAGTRTASPTNPSTGAAEASFKWKSNILLRMRKEQTVTPTAGGRWTDLSSGGPVAATGS